MNDIFIQIASYKDPQLIPTVLDCIRKARWPERLRFCIAYQNDGAEDISELRNDDKSKIDLLDIKASDSLGTCWARNLIQQEYGGEKYTLAIDSHHRFIENWDERLISLLSRCDSGKPLLTTYAPSFDPDNDPDGRVREPWKLNFDRFTPEGCVFMRPAIIDNWRDIDRPITSRFLSAHFIFTTGQFAKEVRHDPNYYFHGEEISLAVRSFTHGYDLFTPNELVIWHEYTRNGRAKHWDEHSNWGSLNRKSHQRNRVLLGMEDGDIDFGEYGLGNKRSLRDYEKYAGIHFKNRSVQPQTLNHELPPNTYKYKTEKEWEDSFVRRFKHCMNLLCDKVPLTDYDFWCVGILDENGEMLYREDADENEISKILNSKSGLFYNIWRECDLDKTPSRWIVWPHSKSKGWCDKIESDLG